MKHELIYHSYANPDITNEQINNIIEVAKDHNAKLGITGCLLYHHKQFVQLLEGERDEIERLFEIISQDSRHSQIEMLHIQPIENHLFKKSPMAFDVVDKDDFAYIGASGKTDLEFFKNDLASGKKLLERISKLIEVPVDRMHSKPFGPSA